MIKTKIIEVELTHNESDNPLLIEAGNQGDDGSVEIVFTNDDIFVEGHAYFITFTKGDNSFDLPIKNNKLIISSALTIDYGVYSCNLFLLDGDEKVKVYDEFLLKICKTHSTYDMGVDKNLIIFYNDLLQLKKDLEYAIENAQKGETGDSAYQIAVNNGFKGTEKEWLLSLNGEDGYTPVKGKDYSDGKDFTYEDFTEEQLEALKVKGDKGDSFTYDDFTEEQIESLKIKGDKGDPFEFEDFTNEQLESLKVKGDAFTYEDFTEEQIESLKVKGDAFTYDDFTDEQLESLKPQKGLDYYTETEKQEFVETVKKDALNDVEERLKAINGGV